MLIVAPPHERFEAPSSRGVRRTVSSGSVGGILPRGAGATHRERPEECGEGRNGADVIDHYDKDEPHAPSAVVAIRIDSAEYGLKPFVDAILAKYGAKRGTEEEPLGIQAQN